MKAMIYKPSPNAMQTGFGKKAKWILELAEQSPTYINPVMGWNGSADTQKQVKLKFNSCYEAEDYAKRNAIEYRIIEPKARKVKPKSYAANFQ